GMLDGIGLRGPDRDPDVVLHQELLRCPQLPFDPDGTPTRPVTVDDVATAAQTSWADAFDARLAAEDFATAHLIIDADPDVATDPGRARSVQDRLASEAAQTRAELRTLRSDVAADVEKAARLGQLDETASATVMSRLEAAVIGWDEDAASSYENLGV